MARGARSERPCAASSAPLSSRALSPLRAAAPEARPAARTIIDALLTVIDYRYRRLIDYY